MRVRGPRYPQGLAGDGESGTAARANLSPCDARIWQGASAESGRSNDSPERREFPRLNFVCQLDTGKMGESAYERVKGPRFWMLG